MPITNDSLNKDLYRLLKVRGFDPVPKDSEGETTPVPDEADVFKFTFKRHDKPYGTAWVTVDSNQQLVVYFKDEINNVDGLDEGEDPAEYDDSWTGFLKNLKMWAQRRQLGFDIENQDHLASDMAQRTHMKKKEQISEGYYPMGKQASYSDAVPTVKIVLQHTRQIQEGEQRFRNIARIFLENTQGERILCPFNRPGMAQIYARHLAEGGKPNDERWNHIGSLCEEYTKMAGFARAVKNGQFNESAQKLVEAGMNHFINLRESLGKMRGHRGYNAYFESWTPTLMETEGDEPVNINELFVQETLDPRIESVMPILSKLSKNLGEMKEVDELAEWADKLVEAPGDETLAHNQSTEEKRLKALDLDEDGPSDAEAAHQKINTPAFIRQKQAKEKGGAWKVTGQDLAKAKERNISGPEGLAALKQLAGLGEDKGKIVVVNPEAQQEMLDWLESEGFDAPEPTTDENGNLVYDFKDMDHNAYVYASDYDIGSKEADDDIAEQGVAEGKYDPAKDTFNPETHAAITKDGVDKLIPKSQLAKYKEQGWKERHSLKAFHKNREKQGVAEGEVDEAIRGLMVGNKGYRQPQTQAERDAVAKSIRTARTDRRADPLSNFSRKGFQSSITPGGGTNADTVDKHGSTTGDYGNYADPSHTAYYGDGKIKTRPGAGKGVAEGLNEFAQGDFNGGDNNDLLLYLNVARKLNMKRYKPSTANAIIAKKMEELVDVVDDDKVDWARHMARKEQGLPNMLDQQGVAEGAQEDARFTPRPEFRQKIEDELYAKYLDPDKSAWAYTNVDYFKHDGKVYVEVVYRNTKDDDLGRQRKRRFLVNKDFTLTPILIGGRTVGEGVAGPKNCWPGHRKVGTQPGTGKNAGKRVNDCEEIEEGQFAGDFATGKKAQWRNKGPKANKPAEVGDLVGANESIERDPLDDLKRLLGK